MFAGSSWAPGTYNKDKRLCPCRIRFGRRQTHQLLIALSAIINVCARRRLRTGTEITGAWGEWKARDQDGLFRGRHLGRVLKDECGGSDRSGQRGRPVQRPSGVKQVLLAGLSLTYLGGGRDLEEGAGV